MSATASSATGETVEHQKWAYAATAERSVSLARGVVFTTALLMMESELFIGGRTASWLDFLVAVAVVYAVGTSVFAVLGNEESALQFPLLVADMLLITGIIYAAGGVNEYYLLYYIPILQASIRLNFRDAVASALLSSGLYGLVGLSLGTEILVPMTTQLRALTFGASALFMAVFFGLLSREARAHIKRSEHMTRLAEALARKNQELEETTRELAEAQQSLLAAERLATIGELAASLGHELRNPLGVIRNASYYLRTRLGGREADLDEMVDLMDSEVGTCDRTIAALLDFARPEQASPERLALRELVETVAAKKPPPPNVTLDLQIAPDLPLVFADRHQLEQVFHNVSTNAYHAMANGGTLAVRGSVEEGGMVRVEWSDTGPGIAPEHLDRIFDPLFTTKAKGIGLGLVVCKRYVERQGGAIEIRSAPGEGATVIIRLPQAEVEQDG